MMWVKELRGLVVQGGFLDGLEVNFQSGLNCIIGPRGTGKSSILNLIRFALGDWPGQPREFVGKMNGLLGDGQVEVEFVTEVDNIRRIKRRIGRYPRLYDDKGQLVQEGREMRFNLEAYHQGQLELLLDQGGTALMDMLDRTIEDLEPLLRDLEANIAKRTHLQRDYETEAEKLNELKEQVERKDLLLKELAALQLNEPEKRKQALVQEAALFEFWEKLFSSRVKTLHNMLKADYHTCRMENAMLLNPDLVESFIVQVNQTLEVRQQLADELIKVMEEGLAAIKELGADLAKRHQNQEEQIMEDLRQQGFAGCTELAQRRQNLMRELAELTGCEEEYQKTVTRIRHLTERKQILLVEAERLENSIFRLRHSTVNRLNAVLAGNPWIHINKHSDIDEYRRFLQQRLQGTVSRRMIDDLARRLDGRTLMNIVNKADSELLSRTLQCGTNEARQIIWVLGQRMDSGRMTEIPVGDEAALYYRNKSGVESVNSYHLSRGTQCSLLLPIVLLARKPVLIGDQFEDHLDNACIYDMVIPRLLNIKKTRQVILVTHNPNIVVGGQADWVIAMTLEGGNGRLKQQGKLDEESIRWEVMSTLEGGKEAFCCRVEYLGVG
ncbi:MAG: AAA family ATPase [Syntrophomonadaceae bacterium]|jgi:DNA repair exonuclease SbcCD ATPase subunit|nr:AAA family ATPase [Syntrophomonadaceae bacterium]